MAIRKLDLRCGSKAKLWAGIVSSALLLTGCYGGGGDDSRSGVLTDSAIQGVPYQTIPSGRSGVTDENGRFNYVRGDRVIFNIGGVEFPAIPGSDRITPALLAQQFEGVEQDVSLNIAILMQALDSDGNPDNGITIEPGTDLSQVGGLLQSIADTSPDAFATLLDGELPEGLNAPSPFEALEHYFTTEAPGNWQLVSSTGFDGAPFNVADMIISVDGDGNVVWTQYDVDGTPELAMARVAVQEETLPSSMAEVAIGGFQLDTGPQEGVPVMLLWTYGLQLQCCEGPVLAEEPQLMEGGDFFFPELENTPPYVAFLEGDNLVLRYPLGVSPRVEQQAFSWEEMPALVFERIDNSPRSLEGVWGVLPDYADEDFLDFGGDIGLVSNESYLPYEVSQTYIPGYGLSFFEFVNECIECGPIDIQLVQVAEVCEVECEGPVQEQERPYIPRSGTPSGELITFLSPTRMVMANYGDGNLPPGVLVADVTNTNGVLTITDVLVASDVWMYQAGGIQTIQPVTNIPGSSREHARLLITYDGEGGSETYYVDVARNLSTAEKDIFSQSPVLIGLVIDFLENQVRF